MSGTCRSPPLVITFKSTEIENMGSNKLTMTGDLSILGLARATALDVTINNITSSSDNPVTAGFDADGVVSNPASEWAGRCP